MENAPNRMQTLRQRMHALENRGYGIENTASGIQISFPNEGYGVLSVDYHRLDHSAAVFSGGEFKGLEGIVEIGVDYEGEVIELPEQEHPYQIETKTDPRDNRITITVKTADAHMRYLLPRSMPGTWPLPRGHKEDFFFVYGPRARALEA